MPAFANSKSEPDSDDGALAVVKILVVGGFGVGKTTLVGTISEIEPLTTEADLTEASSGHDALFGGQAKSTTTVALDFGRITLRRRGLQLLLFGAPGQPRFWFMWDDLATGALGAVVLADTRRFEDCFPVVEYCEKHSLPFVVAVNQFDRADRYLADEVREALSLGASVPVLACDAREPGSVRAVLVALAGHALALTRARRLPTRKD